MAQNRNDGWTAEEFLNSVFHDEKKGKAGTSTENAPRPQGEAGTSTEKTPLLKGNAANVETVGNPSGSNGNSSYHGHSQSSHEGNESNAHHGHEEKKVSTLGTTIFLLKANVSTGILAMPKALSNFGLLAGVIGILVLGALYVYCTNLLFIISKGIAAKKDDEEETTNPSNVQMNQPFEVPVNIRNRNREERIDGILKTLDFPTVVDLSFQYGSNELKCFRPILKFYTKFLLMATHIGCCCVCFLFIAETLSEIPTTAKYVSAHDSWIILAYAIPIVICISFLPDRYEMTGVTTMAFFLQIFGIAIMMFYIFPTGEKSQDFYPFIAPSTNWPLYFGVVFYAFEGTGITLHLESHMEDRKAFRGATGVFNKWMLVFIIPLFAIFGVMGYWKFGNHVHTSVTFNLPDDRIGIMVQVMTCLGILLTYAFHFSFVLTPLKKLLISDDLSETSKQVLDLGLRAVFVVTTFIMSALVPHMEAQLSILGATTSCFLILVLPPMMAMNINTKISGINLTCCGILLHYLIMLLGASGTVVCSVLTFNNLPLYFPNSSIFH